MSRVSVFRKPQAAPPTPPSRLRHGLFSNRYSFVYSAFGYGLQQGARPSRKRKASAFGWLVVVVVVVAGRWARIKANSKSKPPSPPALSYRPFTRGGSLFQSALEATSKFMVVAEVVSVSAGAACCVLYNAVQPKYYNHTTEQHCEVLWVVVVLVVMGNKR
jgi:hypothetical protein